VSGTKRRSKSATLSAALLFLAAQGCTDRPNEEPAIRAERLHIEDPGDTAPLPRDGSDGTQARRNAACGAVMLDRLEDGLASRTYKIRDRNGSLTVQLRPAAVSYVCAGSENDDVPELDNGTDSDPNDTAEPRHSSLYPAVEGVEVRWLPASEAWVPAREGGTSVDLMHFIVDPDWADRILEAKNRIAAARGDARAARCREAMALEPAANPEPARLSVRVYVRTGAWPELPSVTLEELGEHMQTGSWPRHVADFRVVSSYLETIEAACR